MTGRRRKKPGAEIGPWDLTEIVWSGTFPGGTSDRALTWVLLKAGDGCTGANARISLTGISRRTGLGRETVVACIRRLEGLGLISRELHPYKTTVYAVQVSALLDQASTPTSQPNRLVHESDQSGRKGDLGVVGKTTQGGRNGDHYRTSSVPLSVPSSVQTSRKVSDRGNDNGDEPLVRIPQKAREGKGAANG